MRAVAEGYLNYKDCELDGQELTTLERWTVDHLRRKDTNTLRQIKIKTNLATLPLSKEPSTQIEAVQELVDGIFDDIIGTAQRAVARGDEARYKSVFGDVNPEEVEKLNEHLENKSLAIQQEVDVKQQALERLEQALQKKFKRRI